MYIFGLAGKRFRKTLKSPFGTIHSFLNNPKFFIYNTFTTFNACFLKGKKMLVCI